MKRLVVILALLVGAPALVKAAPIDDRNAQVVGNEGLIVATDPTAAAGCAQVAGTINVCGNTAAILLNGNPVGGGLAVPNHAVIGGNGSTLTFVTLPTGDLLANPTGSSADPAATSLTELMDYVYGNTQGDILYRSTSGWSVLTPGTSGNCLQTGGASANPSWGSCGGGGSVPGAAQFVGSNGTAFTLNSFGPSLNFTGNTLTVVYGTGANTAAQGNDSRITNAAQLPVSPTNGHCVEFGSSNVLQDAGSACGSGGGGGNVTGPGSATVGHVATYGNTGGTLLADGGALGTAAAQNTGTSGATVPLLNGTNTWAARQTFSALVVNAPAAYAAAGTTCAAATPITTQIANVTSSSANYAGVVPPAIAGVIIQISDAAGVPINVCPASGVSINGLTAGAPVSLVAGGAGTWSCASSTLCSLN